MESKIDNIKKTQKYELPKNFVGILVAYQNDTHTTADGRNYHTRKVSCDVNISFSRYVVDEK